MITECPYCSKNAISWYRKLVIFNKFTCLSCNKTLVLNKDGKFLLSFVLGAVFLFLAYSVELPMVIAIGIATVLVLPFKLLLQINRSELKKGESVNKSYFWSGFFVYLILVLAYVSNLDNHDYGALAGKWERITGNQTAQSFSTYLYRKSFFKGGSSSSHIIMSREYDSKNWAECAKWAIISYKYNKNRFTASSNEARECIGRLTEEDILKVEAQAADLFKQVKGK